LVLIIWVLDAVICWLRVRPVERDRLWAEDSVIFIRGWVLNPSIWIPFRPYSGYVQFLPSSISGVISMAPTYYWALFTTAAACIVVGSVGAVAFHCSRYLLTSWPARAAVALAPVLLPLAGVEPLGNLCNLHWWAIYAVFWLLFARTGKRWSTALLVAYTLIWMLSETTVLFFVPLAVLILWRSKNLGQKLISVAVLVGSVVQLAAYLSTGRGAYSSETQHVAQVVKGMLISVFGGTLTESAALAQSVAQWFGYRSMAVVAIMSLVPVLIAFWGAPAKIRLAIFYAGGLAMFLWPFTAYLLKFPGGAPLVPWRWGMGPALCLMTIWILALDQFVQRRRLDVMAATLIIGALFVVQCCSFSTLNDRRVGGTAWRDFVVAGQAECRAGATEVASPGFPQEWAWMVPCTRLR